MTAALWLSVTVVCALGAMSPGPSLAVVIRNTVGNGRAHGLATAWSHAAGIGLYALLTTFGLAVAIVHFRPAWVTIAGLSALYLFYLGVQALRSAGRIETEASPASLSLARSAREGFFIALLNPKVAVFFLAVFSQFLRPGMGRAEHLLMSAIATLVDGTWYSLVALLLTRPGWIDRLRRRAPWIERTTGTVLIVLAIVGAARLASG